MKVFYSWQSDVHALACRKFIKDCLTQAIAAAGEALELEEANRPELDEATKGAAGMVDIASTILAKIAASAVYAADVTPLVRSPRGKALPNPNVVFELGWACAKPGFERVIAVMNTVDGYKVDDLPFDIRNRRVIPYSLKNDATAAQVAREAKQLVALLTDAIRTNLQGHIDEVARDAPIPSMPTLPDDPSRWTTESITILSYSGTHHQVTIPKRPQAFLRLKTIGWPSGPPSPDIFLKLPQAQQPETMTGYTSSHGTGRFSEGAIRFHIITPTSSHPTRYQSNDLAAYFEALGEVLVIIGCVHPVPKGEAIDLPHALAGWRNALDAANLFMDAQGARYPREAIAGIVSIHGAWLPLDNNNARQSIKSKVEHSLRHQAWDHQAQTQFRLDLLNKLRAAFGLPALSTDEMLAIDRNRYR